MKKYEILGFVSVANKKDSAKLKKGLILEKNNYVVIPCPMCGYDLVVRKGNAESLMSCLNFPNCKLTQQLMLVKLGCSKTHLDSRIKEFVKILKNPFNNLILIVNHKFLDELRDLSSDGKISLPKG